MFGCADDVLVGPSLRLPGSVLGELHTLGQPLLKQQQQQHEQQRLQQQQEQEEEGEEGESAMDEGVEQEQPLTSPTAEQLQAVGAGSLLLRYVCAPCGGLVSACEYAHRVCWHGSCRNIAPFTRRSIETLQWAETTMSVSHSST